MCNHRGCGASANPRETHCRTLARSTALAVLLALITACAHSSADEQALTGDQIRKLITGNTLQGSYVAKPLTMVFYEDGQVRGSLGLTGSDSGTWEIEGDKYCDEWIRYFQSVHHCYIWIPQGDGYLLKNVDAYRAYPIQGRIEQGKPKGY